MASVLQPEVAIGEGSGVQFDTALIRKYGGRGPRYTSYPTAPHFSDRFNATDYRRHAAASNAQTPPLSIYVHIPFCRSLCYYCGCTKVVTRNAERVDGYLRHLYAEIAAQGALYDRDRTVEQLHLGGGTPTYLSHAQLGALLGLLRGHFTLAAGRRREYSIEVDPRTIGPADVSGLAELGFNRVSFGVQDFDPTVQAAVNRVQPPEQTLSLITQARAAGFDSVNVDLIYGLPFQSVQSFDQTLDALLAARPDRIAVYSYAHLPAMFKSQRLIREEDLPSAAEKLELLQQTVERLGRESYVYVGMDHFALPEDELVRAQRRGELQRNFQGYSTHAETDLVAVGISAISKVAGCYAQNERSVERYGALLDAGSLPVVRGIALGTDDRLRADLIQQLMCHGRVPFAPLETRHGIVFGEYFATELRNLRPLEEDGLVRVGSDHIEVTARGRLLLRAIAMVFDRYSAPQAARHSRLI